MRQPRCHKHYNTRHDPTPRDIACYMPEELILHLGLLLGSLRSSSDIGRSGWNMRDHGVHSCKKMRGNRLRDYTYGCHNVFFVTNTTRTLGQLFMMHRFSVFKHLWITRCELVGVRRCIQTLQNCSAWRFHGFTSLARGHHTVFKPMLQWVPRYTATPLLKYWYTSLHDEAYSTVSSTIMILMYRPISVDIMP